MRDIWKLIGFMLLCFALLSCAEESSPSAPALLDSDTLLTDSMNSDTQKSEDAIGFENQKTPDSTTGADSELQPSDTYTYTDTYTDTDTDTTTTDTPFLEDDASDVEEEPACDDAEGFLCPCEDSTDCQSGFCVEGPDGNICSTPCVEECPDGFQCKFLSGTGPDVVYLCIPSFVTLCRPCINHTDCQGLGESDNRCVSFGLEEGSFCGSACVNDEDCPSDHSCAVFDEDEPAQCAPNAGECKCSSQSVDLAASTLCAVQNEFGTCEGERVCKNEGLTSCNALTPEEEVCDGEDNNCDGEVDEDTRLDTCTLTNDVGSCEGSFLCDSGQLICDADDPTPEVCDGVDNDCNGDTDEGFDLKVDVNHCGTCGNECVFSEGTPACVDGVCQLSTCEAGYGDCNGDTSDGCETVFATDANHCGSCATKCTNENGSALCASGVCIPQCDPSFADCDSVVNNGCETAINTLTNCGSCDVPCAYDNASESCESGSCLLIECESEFADCDNIEANGCESNTTTDNNNCGTCGTECVNNQGSSTCTAGSCILSCIVGWDDCDGLANTGCETPLNTVSDCNACGELCDLNNAVELCAPGNCYLISCDSGYANCDGNDGNGCEININIDVNSCGACGTVCSNAHGNTSCTSGLCTPTCDSGWESCDGNQNNGCETHTQSDIDSCGACDTECVNSHGVTTCSAGTCVPSCDSGWADCDGNAVNGCETNINTLSNCGGCGETCSVDNGNATCQSGSCELTSCDATYVDANGTFSDGCECKITGSDSPDDAFKDANCDGIDGDISNAIFVSPEGSDSDIGTISNPLKSIYAGLYHGYETGKDVYVAGGNYSSPNSLYLKNGVSIYGGYDKTNWSRSVENTVTLTVSNSLAFYAYAITESTTLDMLTVIGANNTSSGGSAYGLFALVADGLTVRNCDIRAGNAANGTHGSAPSPPAANAGAPGEAGNPGCEDGDGIFCSQCAGTGSMPGGLNWQCQDARGGAGGSGAKGSENGNDGKASFAGTPGGAGTPPNMGNWTPGDSYVGKQGADGATGTDGAACIHAYSDAGIYSIPSVDGGPGVYGKGGGGGGGGGGGDDSCDSYGGGGGSGGAGGCGGLGGTRGTGAGSSFAVYLADSDVVIENCILEAGNGGEGGNASVSQAGGIGAQGGSTVYGGVDSQDDGSNGAPGGKGGNGGQGGVGGSGCGGHSICVLKLNSNPTLNNVSYQLGSAGEPGMTTGNQGQSGIAKDIFNP